MLLSCRQFFVSNELLVGNGHFNDANGQSLFNFIPEIIRLSPDLNTLTQDPTASLNFQAEYQRQLIYSGWYILSFYLTLLSPASAF